MQVQDGMSRVVLVVGPGHTLRDAARLMAERRVGAAVVNDPDNPGPGIITERDVVDSLGGGQDPDTELVSGLRATVATDPRVTSFPEPVGVVVADAVLRGAGAPSMAKSPVLLSLSVVPAPFRNAAVVLESTAVGVDSEQLAPP